MECKIVIFYRDIGRFYLVKFYFVYNANTCHQTIQGNHAIAKMTARCAEYVSALKIVGLGKRKISRRLRKNLHITIRR